MRPMTELRAKYAQARCAMTVLTEQLQDPRHLAM
jgi:hypothetical protein